MPIRQPRFIRARSGATLIAAILLAAGLFVAGGWLDIAIVFRAALAWISDLGPWGWAIFIAMYTAATVLVLPTFLLTLGAGAVYGILGGAALASVGATLGATAAFFIGRHLARDWVARYLEDHPMFRALDQVVAREGWKIVGLTRLTPAIPFVVKNYAYGLTQVSPRDYILASWVAMTPGILLNAYMGSLVGNLATLGTQATARGPLHWALYTVGFGATVAVTVYVARLARAALHERLDTTAR